MNLPRRKFLRLAASAAALPVLSSLARAQTYPLRSVRLLVGYAAGGAPDVLARLMGQWLSERLSQQYVIENRPGAGSSIATEAVVNATADGYTLLLASLANAVNASLYDKLNYNFMRDIVPVAGISQDANVMVVNTSVAIKTVPEFIAMPKPIRANSAWRRPATAVRLTWRVSYSNSWPESTWCMCPIGVRRPRLLIC